MKTNYNVSSNNFKAKDYNVDTIYIRYDEKYYKVLDHKTIKKEEVSKEEFDKLDKPNKLVTYTEEQYAYREYIEVLENSQEDLNIGLANSNLENLMLNLDTKNSLELEQANSNLESLMMIMELKARVEELEEQLKGE